jgi:hypothetical protein
LRKSAARSCWWKLKVLRNSNRRVSDCPTPQQFRQP